MSEIQWKIDINTRSLVLKSLDCEIIIKLKCKGAIGKQV